MKSAARRGPLFPGWSRGGAAGSPMPRRVPVSPAPLRRAASGAKIAGVDVSGAVLGEIGLAIPAQRPLTAVVVVIEAMTETVTRPEQTRRRPSVRLIRRMIRPQDG